jgi:hypothetical protein
VVTKMQKTLLTLAMVAIVQNVTMGQQIRLDGPPPILNSPPTIFNLGSNVSDGSVSVECTGIEPYSKLSCKVYHLEVERASLDEYQRHRAALQKELATTSNEDFHSEQAVWCNPAINSNAEKEIANYSPGRAAEVRNRYKQKQAICGCATKECYTSVRLEQQTHEQNECTFSSSVFSADFVRVGDSKWVSNNGPEGICGVVSVLTIEHEPNYTNLWTYTEQYIYTNNAADELCKLAHNYTSTYSWKSEKSVRVKCEELKFTTNPEVEQILNMVRNISSAEEKKP